MSWDLVEALHLNVGSQVGVALDFNGNGLSTRSDPFSLRFADCFTVRLYLYDGILSTTPVAIPSGYEMILAAKELVSDVPTGPVLFNATSFAPVTVDGKQAYEAQLDLNTTELSTALGTDASLQCQCDLEIQNAGNTLRKTFSFKITILPQSYAGEGSPTPGAPAYPLPAAIITSDLVILPAGKRVRINDDLTLQLEDIP